MVTCLSFPLRNDNTVLGLQCGVLRVRIQEDHLAEISVEVREVLQPGESVTGIAREGRERTLTIFPLMYRVDSR